MALSGEYAGTADFVEGLRLFELGNDAASQHKHSEALEYYAQSIAACPKPPAYINRARIFVQRIRYLEAMSEMREANRLDIAQGKEFSAIIEEQINWVQSVLSNYNHGRRDELIVSLEDAGHRRVAEHILCTAFNIPDGAWECRSIGTVRQLVEFHFFNEINNIVIFDDISLYPETNEFFKMYGEDFIYNKVRNCPDVAAYKDALFIVHDHLCSFEQSDLRRIRKYMHHDIHVCLLTMDYGDMFDTFSSDCNGLIREANEFYAQN